MTGRRAIQLGVLAAGLVFAVGCSSKPAPPRAGGGSSASKAEKARNDAEALALSGFDGAADAQAKAVPAAAARRDGPAFDVRIDTQGGEATAQFTPPAPGKASPPTPPAPLHPIGAPAPPGPVAPLTPPPPMVAVPPARSTPPRPTTVVVVRERVTSGVSTNETDAEAEALLQARDVIERKLAELDPPVRYRPSEAEVKAEFVRRGSRAVRQPDAEKKALFVKEGITGNLVYVEYDVEVSAEQVRQLRSQERSATGVRIVGMLIALALAGFLFLRADEWTRGYLTSWLALAAVALAGGAAAALIFI